jgi:sucrose-6-phosphate hydrolase SacC (GH32 family)
MHRSRSRWGGVIAMLAVLTSMVGAGIAQAQVPTYQEQYRPQFHYSQGSGFVNDPNGLVYYAGEYHLFYQDRLPCGQSWGHAISRDLVHWTELPKAIPCEGTERIFSGSVVIDKNNATGFGTPDNPAMVAIYTSARPGSQAQSLAYSLDRGRTWTKYAGNPVLDIGSGSFRDPKVFWYEPDKRWIMPVALSSQRKVAFYSSTNLKEWTFESDFGPVGSVSGEYEVPDLFPLTVEGDDHQSTKWVLLVNVNPGARLGGSGLQYFIGDFDGHRFEAESVEPYTAPSGTVFADFEADTYGDWTATGGAFGSGPTAGAVSGQNAIVGMVGQRLVNSRQPNAAATGTLTSPPFVIRKKYINMRTGGADLPRLPGATSEATVNLVVGGEVVRSESGDNSTWMDWDSFDVRELIGKTARIQLVDTATSGQGSILLDQVVFSDERALSEKERADWADWGRDFYAAITFDNMPDGRRLMIGWMSNWLYPQSVPTSPWRSVQSEPRELSLRRIGGELQLVQHPVRELEMLRNRPAHKVHTLSVNDRTRVLDGAGARGKALDIEAKFDSGTAERFGLKVFTGPGEETVVGYDTRTERLYLDRTRSGNVGFHPRFASVSTAPLRLGRDGKLKLRVLVDNMLVEVFADHGQRVFTEQVFPGTGSDGVQVFAEGGRATVSDMTIWQMESIWFPDGAGGSPASSVSVAPARSRPNPSG